MSLYLDYSAKIVNIYKRFVHPEDIHIYSIDEVFIDATSYIKKYKSSHDMLLEIIKAALYETGITATAGIGPNLYLAKIAMDIMAKKMKADKDGIRTYFLDERKYREELWDHLPLTDFWRLGKGTEKTLNKNGIYTMGDICLASLNKFGDSRCEDLLYKLFGVGAELLIDHAWGKETCTIKDIKNYKPKRNSISSGQVLFRPYSFEEGKTILSEMVENFTYKLIESSQLTGHISLTISFDEKSLENIKDDYKGEIRINSYGRKVPRYAHLSKKLDSLTMSVNTLKSEFFEIYEKIVNKDFYLRKISISFGELVDLKKAREEDLIYKQQSLFDLEKNYSSKTELDQEKELRLQKTLLNIRQKFGANSIMKADSLKEEATGIDRNNQIGGHRA